MAILCSCSDCISELMLDKSDWKPFNICSIRYKYNMDQISTDTFCNVGSHSILKLD